MILRNKYMPFRGFVAMNFFGLLLVRNSAQINATIMRHEQIHTAQMRELLFVPFYVWYVIEWLVRLCLCFRPKQAYRNISFEREAYANQANRDYLKHRKHYAYLRYLSK